MLSALSLHNRQRRHKLSLKWLRLVGDHAMPACRAAAKSTSAPLTTLSLVEVSIVSDREIARVHGEFLDDPTPTDVITFQHGEILISADTAMRQGSEYGQSFEHEVALYLIHGLLHLAGWEDEDEGEAAEMARLQEAILQAALASIRDAGAQS